MDEEAIDSFTGITGASRAVAERFISLAGGDPAEAIEAYYAEAAGPSVAEPAAAPGPRKAAARKAAAGNVRGLGDLQGEEDESEDDDHNDYYVGGEKSGQVVRGAPKAPENPDGVEGLFESARRAGAREGRPADLQAPSGPGFSAFAGRGRTLAGGDVAPEAPRDEAQGSRQRAVTITFYRNGVFTVDEGPPRRMDDPANMPFMTAIARGQCPPELDPGDPDVQIAVNMVRRDDEYEAPPEPKYRAFEGTGRRLVAEEGGAAGSSPPAAPAPALGSSTWEGADPAQPTTSIQLRLADGSRMVAEFNLTQTVADIRRFIHAARPDMPPAYELVTAFPSAQLTDNAATIADAGLANSVVIQKA